MRVVCVCVCLRVTRIVHGALVAITARAEETLEEERHRVEELEAEVERLKGGAPRPAPA